MLHLFGMFMAAVIGFLVVILMLMGAWQRHLDREEKKETLEKLQDAVVRGSNKPLAQYPQINPYTCIGCGSCIEACPEDEVIGLVNGIAHIVHGSRCVGHGNCEFACPVGAIKVGLGDVALRPDIPVLSKDMETSIPGVYIAGELGGIALIRNAIAQGSQAIDVIAQKLRNQRAPQVSGAVDVVILGAGPAGMAASLRAIEHKLNYVTVSQDEVGGAVRKYPRRKLTLVQAVNIPLYGKMQGGEHEKEELVALWEKIIRTHNVKIQTGIGLKDIKRKGDRLEVLTSSGSFLTRSVVIAIGRRGIPRKLGVPGEETGKVMYELIDAATYNRQKLLIVGGGDSAVEAAIGLANQTSNTVTMSYRKENFFRLKSRNEQRIRDYMAQKRIQVVFSSDVRAIEPEAVTLIIERQGRKQDLRVPNDYVFIFAGGDPPYPLLKQIGIRFGGETTKAAA
jgi:thioredoxin reductase/NAD-dependent dihydropyrimidine dehydrogenase PreA subunit